VQYNVSLNLVDDGASLPVMKYLAMTMMVVALAGSQAHAAAKTVTLLGVSGTGGERLATQLESELQEMYEVVPGEVYKSMAARMGKPGATPEEVQAVASQLRIDAVIGGSIVGTGHARQLMVAVRDGSTGRVIARGKYEITTVKALKQRLVADLVQALERSSGSASSKNEDEAAPITGETTRVSKRAPAPERPVAGIAASLGPTLMTRQITFANSPTPEYRSGTMVGLRADLALFPFALAQGFASEHPVLASFGVLGSYEHVFGFAYPVEGGTTTGHGERYDILLAGRIPLGHKAVGGYLQLETGFAHVGFSHDDPVAAGLPNVSYDTIDAGFSWDRTVGVPWAKLGFHFAYLAPLSAGDIVTPGQYGRASAWGIDAGAGLTFIPFKWMWLRLDGRYNAVGLKFAGTGAVAAASSTDQFPSGTLSVGFAL
jgi:hypothetical protein